MSIPSFKGFFGPVLKVLDEQDGSPVQLQTVSEKVVQVLGLSEEEARERIPKGAQTVVYNRTSWAIQYLRDAGMVERASYGKYRITDLGRENWKEYGNDVTVERLGNDKCVSEKQFVTRLSFEDYMLPALKGLQTLGNEPENAVGGVHIRTLRDWIKNHLSLTDEETTILLPSGRVTEFAQRVSWAVHSIFKAELIERVGHGKYRILEQGEDLLKEEIEKIDRKQLQFYPSYAIWQEEMAAPNRASQMNPSVENDNTESVNKVEDDPYLVLEQAVEYYNRVLESDLLDMVKNANYLVLERLVVDLLIKLGYGDGNPERGHLTKSSGDGGIDGVIEEDSLGLGKILIQAKRYTESSIGSGAVQSFVGAMTQRGANKGVFVTTSKFSDEAQGVVKAVTDKHIALIDGVKLARLMRENEIGVRDVTAYWKMKIDESYFDDNEES